MNGVVTLLSDFGLSDGYVAAMKGVLLREAPAARIVDAGHDVPPQDVRGAGWVLSQYWNWYPAGTVHIAVVDPGVGTRRMPLIATGGGHVFLAPDNGLLSWVARRSPDFRAGVVRPEVHLPSGVSATFHGRDVFAYAAGLIASGRATAADLADPVASIVVGPWVAPNRENDVIWGEIVHLDRFGNAVTNITVEDLGDVSRWRIEARSYIMHRVLRTYGDVAPTRSWRW